MNRLELLEVHQIIAQGKPPAKTFVNPHHIIYFFQIDTFVRINLTSGKWIDVVDRFDDLQAMISKLRFAD